MNKKYRITCSGCKFATNTTSGEADLIQGNSLKDMVSKFLGSSPYYTPKDRHSNKGTWIWEGKFHPTTISSVGRLHAIPFGVKEFPNVEEI